MFVLEISPDQRIFPAVKTGVASFEIVTCIVQISTGVVNEDLKPSSQPHRERQRLGGLVVVSSRSGRLLDQIGTHLPGIKLSCICFSALTFTSGWLMVILFTPLFR